MYSKIENYMLECMNDGAHDCLHVYRVLYSCLELAKDYDADTDVLIAAALLHDIGREAQFRNPDFDHAVIGADMAFDFLQTIGWIEDNANRVKECILTHRFRSANPPITIEAKILFDADNLDTTGTVGIARTLACGGIISRPLYSIDEQGNVIDCKNDKKESFFREYNFKLKNVYDKFYTKRAEQIAESRRKAGVGFYENMYKEVCSTHQNGIKLMKNAIQQ